MIKFLKQLQDRTPLGWIQLRYDKTRLLVSIGGIAFADLLMFMQLGILNGLFDSNTMLHRKLEADVVLMSSEARQFTNLLTFPRRRIFQAEDVRHPKVVLADEPTAALDKKSGRDVVNLMQTLAKDQGCTILMVTHDNRILDIADRIVYMEDSRLADYPDAATKTTITH